MPSARNPQAQGSMPGVTKTTRAGHISTTITLGLELIARHDDLLFKCTKHATSHLSVHSAQVVAREGTHKFSKCK